MAETNNLHELGLDGWLPRGAPVTDWSDPELARIVRLRLVSDPGFPAWDVSYCWGELKDGTRVRVQLGGVGQLPKAGMRKALVELARRDGVYARGLGLFEAISTLQ